MILARNGKATFVPVETGIRTATSVEIISGIEPGDTLLLSGLLQVREGTTINTTIVDGW